MYFIWFTVYIFIHHNIRAESIRTNGDDCDFDDPSQPFCYWYNFGTELDFTPHKGSTMSHSTGPEGDHSKYQNGSYIYLEASNAKFGDKAKLKSKIFKATIGRTMKLYVYMYGKNVNYFKVIIKRKNLANEELFKISGNHGQKWIEVKIHIVSLLPYELILEAAVGRNFQSDIAIDDIKFIDDKLPKSDWSEWSSWTNCQIKTNWCRRTRFRVCLKKVPCTDQIEQQVTSCAPAHCKIDGHWSKWSAWSPCLAKCGKGNVKRYRQCDEPSPMFGGQKCVGKNVELNSCWSGFCQDGPDDCDFDDDLNPFCHWKNVNETLQFRRKYLWTGTAGTGPSGDHSNNTYGKYVYLETSSPAKFGQFAQMRSKWFEPTKSRTLKFYTYMYGKSVNYLKVLIRTVNLTREIWKLEGNQGKQWLLARIDFSCQVPYQVVFEAGVGKDFQSDIAIDTIHFQDNSDISTYGVSSKEQQEPNNSTFISASLILFQLSIFIQILF